MFRYPPSAWADVQEGLRDENEQEEVNYEVQWLDNWPHSHQSAIIFFLLDTQLIFGEIEPLLSSCSYKNQSTSNFISWNCSSLAVLVVDINELIKRIYPPITLTWLSFNGIIGRRTRNKVTTEEKELDDGSKMPVKVQIYNLSFFAFSAKWVDISVHSYIAKHLQVSAIKSAFA